MSVIVQLTVTSPPEKYQELYDTFVAILPDTAKAQGAISVSCAADPATNSLRVWEVWETVEDQKAYIKWRDERGDLAKLGKLMAKPPVFETMEHLIF